MNRNWWIKCLFLLFFVVLSAVYVYPTIANIDLEKSRFPFKQKINLGLDLQGGLYMVLGVDFNKVFKDVVARQAAGLQESLKDANVTVNGVKMLTENEQADDPRFAIDFDPAKRDTLLAHLKDRSWNLRL